MFFRVYRHTTEKDRLAYAYLHVFLRVYRHTTEKDRLTYAYLHVFLRAYRHTTQKDRHAYAYLHRSKPKFFRFRICAHRQTMSVNWICVVHRTTERTRKFVNVLGNVKPSLVEVREVYPRIKMIKIFLQVHRLENLYALPVQCQDRFMKVCQKMQILMPHWSNLTVFSVAF